ncbi:hypothetical protein R3P38DRAFT_2816036 [Favolaschia claudopus]|uniref:Uncharacterized protein n=1 Tax=Favolaschia claudopus TaxID=2862362 RepID=A0AAV9YZZ5_9AGAR
MPGSDTPQGSRSQRGKNNLEPEMIPTSQVGFSRSIQLFSRQLRGEDFSSDNFTGARRKSTTMFELERTSSTQCLSPALWLYALDNLPNAFNWLSVLLRAFVQLKYCSVAARYRV